MKKALKIIIPIIIIIAVIAVVLVVMNSKPKSNLPEITSSDDLAALVDKLYEGQENLFPSIQTQVIDVTDNNMVKYITGLENGENLEFAVVSEPMITSQAYSLVLAKVKDGVNPEDVAKQMNENIDARKWICVAAEKVYTTSSGNVVCLIMSNEEMAKPIYEKFKVMAEVVGQEFERTEIEPELPEEMY